MEILLGEKYKISCDKYSWTLWKGNRVTKESYDKAKARNDKVGRNTNVSVGDMYWVEEGFFTKLDTLLNKVIKLEEADSKESVEAQRFLDSWKSLMDEWITNVKEIG